MKYLLALAFITLSSASFAGNCTFPSDRASDGSICGDRAATVRPGGAWGGR